MKADVVTVRTFESADARSIAVLIRQLGYAADETFIISRLALLASSANDRIYVAECRAWIVGLLSFHVFPLFHERCMLRAHHCSRSEGGQPRARRRSGAYRGCRDVRLGSWLQSSRVTSGDSRSAAHAFYETVGYHRSHQRFLKIKPS